MAVFENILQMMVSSGAYYIFVWLLFAGLIYGMLEKYEVLGDSSAIAGVALGGSFLIVLGIAFAGPANAVLLDFAGGLGFIAVVLFGTAILLGMSGIDVMDMGEDGGLEGNILAGAGLIFVAIALIGAIGFNVNLESVLSLGSGDVYQDVVFPIAFLIFLLLAIDATTGGGGD
ncbi:hypothetical protein [Candidatus Nanohalobium constans]|uniref:Uncharacterized protein n=1 Tax=Candidatus Nanohalobium constans TaxID=2565781 RepID=A0A5Q0UI03_9ARCH|nr:hypothetical protein [Candidatus Nanohalobium constans]QGA80820.1 hypothetical protein LC1Nh_0938 [Candidatus Nanohalobium constans]